MKTKGAQGRILKVWEMLKQESDENHALSTTDIIEKLANIGITVDRRTIYQDIEKLNNLGYEVLTKKGDFQRNLYYVIDRNFDITELGILVDAVQASSFITEKKTRQLTEKIASLGGSKQGEVLKSAKVDFNTTKHSNEEIYYNIFEIQQAILDRKKLSYKYFDFNAKGEKVYRRNGERYIVSPVATIVNNDNYYFLAYHEKHDSVATYRIDRMVKVEELKENIDRQAILDRQKVSANRKQAFGMFTGEEYEVTFEFDKSLIDVLFDRFGENIELEERNGKVYCTQKVMVSDQFYGWCCGFNNKLRIVEPKCVVDSIKKYINNLADNYN